MFKIGILGGGQLARMILEGCYKYGIEFHILSKEKNSPAGQLTQYETVGDWNNEKSLKEFARECDILTLENEFIDHHKLRMLESEGIEIYPGSETIKLIQDKLFQKQTLERINIPVSKFQSIKDADDIFQFTLENSYPVVLKSRTMGYDGKGNFQINSQADIDNAFDILSKRGDLYCESFVNFHEEVAIQIARNKNGEIKIYPIVHTIQKNHICDLVIASKKNFGPVKDKIEYISKKIVQELNYIGVMGIEMFLIDEDILVNELAPRVHNSGHYTIEGCFTSQFENHIRSIMNLPLGDTEMIAEYAVLKNILGEKNGKADLKGVNNILVNDKTYLHIYGKKETRIGRKMGHITVLSDECQKAIDTANHCREMVEI